ncbi:alpha/beta hydrolase [Candidatus Woesearchaeota archaeon]|nr:alpha/beta hydrolase [Candidatus Woesearchaeota archaeon]
MNSAAIIIHGSYGSPNLDGNSILIGHSIGCAFILSVLEELDVKIKASFLVAGFLGPLGNEFYDAISKTFTQRAFDWKKIKSNCSRFLIYHADNDPHVPLSKGKEIAEKLSVELKIVNGAGHFNEESGYKTFELLLEDIKGIKNTAAKDL